MEQGRKEPRASCGWRPTVQCVAGEARNGFCQYKVDFALLAVLNHLVKTVTLLGMYAGDTVIRVDARNFPLRGGIDFFRVVQFLDFKAALLFFFLGADATVFNTSEC